MSTPSMSPKRDEVPKLAGPQARGGQEMMPPPGQAVLSGRRAHGLHPYGRGGSCGVGPPARWEPEGCGYASWKVHMEIARHFRCRSSHPHGGWVRAGSAGAGARTRAIWGLADALLSGSWMVPTKDCRFLGEKECLISSFILFYFVIIIFFFC